jgi:hypothetical protein
MAQIKSLLGHASLEVAKGKRTCHRNRRKHRILKGESFLLVRSGRFDRKNYCRECALPMIQKAQEDVNGLRAALAPAPGATPDNTPP